MSTPKRLIESRVSDYLKVTWMARWVVIGIVAFSYIFLPHDNPMMVTALILFASAYNALLMVGRGQEWTLFVSRPLLVTADSLFAVMLILGTGGGQASPYVPVLLFMIVSTAYWFGSLAAVLVALAQPLVIWFVSGLIYGWGVEAVLQPGVRALIFAAIGLYLGWLTHAERLERNELMNISQQIEQERQQLLALINNMSDGVLVVDNHGKITIYNQAAAAMASQPNLTNKPVNESLALLDQNDRPVQLRVKHLSAAVERRDLRLKEADSSLIDVAVNIAPYIVNRQNHGYVLVLHDITQTKTVDQEREEFIAVASHELRTPLTVAEGNISLVLLPQYVPANAESQEMLAIAHRSLKQLGHIIDDLTTLSKAENEQLDVELEPLDPVALLGEFKTDYASQIKAKGLQLNLKVAREALPPVLTSRYMTRELLTILLNNAIKFTDKGSIILGVRPAEQDDEGVVFSIADTGIGISRSDQAKIFRKFFQSENYKTRNYGGTGLGLYIAQKLASRLTAKLWCESELKKGSTFYVQVPPYSRHKQDLGKVATAEAKDFFNTL